MDLTRSAGHERPSTLSHASLSHAHHSIVPSLQTGKCRARHAKVRRTPGTSKLAHPWRSGP